MPHAVLSATANTFSKTTTARPTQSHQSSLEMFVGLNSTSQITGETRMKPSNCIHNGYKPN
eukprot:10940839-Karenia_brevis.AAC.1